jgi:hypothetical protein
VSEALYKSGASIESIKQIYYIKIQKALSTNSLTPPSSHNSHISPPLASNTKRVTPNLHTRGGRRRRGRIRSRSRQKRKRKLGSESILDPESAVEARASTDSNKDCDAGSTRAEAVMDIATAPVVTACAGGTGGWTLTIPTTGDEKSRVIGRSGEGEGPKGGSGGPDWIFGTTAAWRAGGGADWIGGS